MNITNEVTLTKLYDVIVTNKFMGINKDFSDFSKD